MKRHSAVIILLLVIAALVPTVRAQDKIDEEATRMIREYTTDPKFLTPLVDYLPASETVPSQLEVLGYISGTPGKLTYYDDILRYYRVLAESSNRVTMFEIGESHQGNMMVVVAISNADTISNLDRYLGYSRELADPRTCDKERMQAVLKEAKPIYMVTGGLHSPETGSPGMLMEMAFRLAVSETEMIQRIRSNVITLIIPVLETDGWNRQVDWYYRHTKKIEKWEDIPARSSPYWGAYTQHDNNRDGIMVSQPLTKNYFKAFFMFHPQISLDLHESVPLLYVSVGTGPYYPSIDPITITEWQWFSFNEVSQLTSYGVPGVWTWGFYTGWYPGYLLWVTNTHNAVGRFYETFGNAGANTYEREISSGRYPGAGRTSRQWYRPVPPPAKVKWSLRNNNNLMQSGVLVSLEFAAHHADKVLENFWTKGKNAIIAGNNESPYAWIIPLEQKDSVAANRLIGVLQTHQVEMHQLTEEFTLDENKFPVGSVVVRMDQPYRTVGKTLLEIQKWPEGNQNNPYDATGWTMGLMLGVNTQRIDDKAVYDAKMQPLNESTPFTGGIEGGAADFVLIEPQGLGMIKLYLELAAEGISARIIDKELTIDDHAFPAGTWVLSGAELDKIKAICSKLGLKGKAIEKAELPELREISMPRLAMYHTWFNTQESGWVRFALDKDSIPYTLINKDRVRDGNLLADFDVIILPHQGGWGGGARILRGVDERYGPLAFNKTEEFKYMGFPDSSSDITGGLGLEGALEFEKFIKGGGTLLAFGSGCGLVTDLGMLRGINSRLDRNIACPGTILAGTVRQPNNPIAYGYCEHPSIYRSSLPLMSVEEKLRKYVVLQFGTKTPDNEGQQMRTAVARQSARQAGAPKDEKKSIPLLRSGLLRNGTAIDGTAAIVDAPLGKGRVVLFAFNPMYRWMNQSSFSFVHNALLNWNAPAEIREAPEKE